MYQEIAIVNSVSCRTARLELFLMFLSEYSGWLNHLENIGASWGADVSSDRVAREIYKVQEHIEKIKNEIRKF